MWQIHNISRCSHVICNLFSSFYSSQFDQTFSSFTYKEIVLKLKEIILKFSNLFVTSKKRNHQFTNLKCCKMSFKAFKMKKQGLKCFFKVRNNAPLKRGFKDSLVFYLVQLIEHPILQIPNILFVYFLSIFSR